MRYDIVSGRDQKLAAERLEEYFSKQRTKKREEGRNDVRTGEDNAETARKR
jgi:hypothetical protein